MDVNLSKAVRSNLLSLQSTAASMAKTQNRLATGLKVNSALDNPSNFFTASALNSRAGDMANLLDGMSSGIKTIEAADNGLKSITKTVESMQSTLRQARQDKSNKTSSYELNLGATPAGTEQLSLSGGAVGATAVDVDLTTTTNTAAAVSDSGSVGSLTTSSTLADAGITISGASTFTVSDGTNTNTFNVTNTGTQTVGDLINSINGDSALAVTASINSSGQFTLTADNNTVGIATGGTVDTGPTGIAASTAANAAVNVVTAKTVDALVTEINANSSLNSAVRASNDGGKLRIENQSTSDLTVGGVSTGGQLTGAANDVEIGGNDVRKNLAKQFNDQRDQLDKFADDASFNGINLLRGDKLKLTFNETGTSTIEIQAKDESGAATSVNNTALGIDAVTDADFDSDAAIDAKLDVLKGSLDSLRSQSSTFGSNLAVVENRQDFTKNMINTLETGAANLTLADTNEEAANLLALQTRQQLSSTALSMASQADQAVLRLF
ncbi:MAG: flagellin [Devosia sp.]|nr:flagellin [Devosia sp.]